MALLGFVPLQGPPRSGCGERRCAARPVAEPVCTPSTRANQPADRGDGSEDHPAAAANPLLFLSTGPPVDFAPISPRPRGRKNRSGCPSKDPRPSSVAFFLSLHVAPPRRTGHRSGAIHRPRPSAAAFRRRSSITSAEQIPNPPTRSTSASPTSSRQGPTRTRDRHTERGEISPSTRPSACPLA